MAKDNAWTEVNPSNDKTWDFSKDGKILVGKYIRKQTDVGPNNSNMYTLESDGKKIGVWGSTVLDSRFELIELNSEVKIEYKGKEKSEKTGREYDDYNVFKKPIQFEEVGNDDPNTEAQIIADEHLEQGELEEPIREEK